MEPGRDGPLAPRPELWLRGDETVWVSVRGTSMVPTLSEGDRVEVRRADPGELAPGDLVAFPRAGELTVHRLLRVEAGGFLEMGDGQGRGNWQPWPETLGLVLSLHGADGRPRDLRSPQARGASDRLARRLARRHRASSFAEHLPGSLLRRGFLRLLRPWIG